jgi:two-component system alkaline phosphatase synthesis response regulator PhoP
MGQEMKRRRGRKRTRAKATEGSRRNLLMEGLSLNVAERSLTRGGKRIHMTPKMCGLLQVFMANRGKVVTRQFLMENVWQTNYMGDTRTLDAHIHMLRKVLGDDSSKPRYLRTVRGVGYRFDIPDA